MKSYILNLTTYGMDGLPSDYDYETASLLWAECDELNETLGHHTVTLTETTTGSLILTGEPDGTNTFPARLERLRLSRDLERIADEYGGFELPSRLLMAEPELNEIIA